MPDVKQPQRNIPEFNFIDDPKAKREFINLFEQLYNYIDYNTNKINQENQLALSRQVKTIDDKLVASLGKKLIGSNTSDNLIEEISTTGNVENVVTEAIDDHEGDSDPHSVYQLESEKGQANGYAPLNSNVDLPVNSFPRTSSNADPSLTEYPNSGDGGIHLNTTSGLVYLSYNNGGVIVKVQLT
jgi:hypothetical protein